MKKSDMTAHFRKSRAFHEFVPVSCFVTDTVFATKAGDYGMVLRVHGMDAECLTEERLESVVAALIRAFHLFGDQFRVYQYLIKNRKMPVTRKESYGNPLVEEAISDRVTFLEATAPLGAVGAYFVVLLESSLHGQRHERPMSSARLREERGKALIALETTVRSFVRYVDRPVCAADSGQTGGVLVLSQAAQSDRRRSRTTAVEAERRCRLAVRCLAT